MKRCPACQRTYSDDSQDFCLYDGTPVVYEAPQQQYYGGNQQQPTGYGAQGYPPPPQFGWTPPSPQGYGYPPMGYAPGAGRGTGLSKAALYSGITALGSFILAVILVMVGLRALGYSAIMMAGILSWLALLAALTAVILSIITLASASKNPAINKVHGILGLCFGGLTLLIWLFGLANSRGRF